MKLKASNNTLPYIAIIIAMILWSSSGIATKIALQGFSPLTLVVLRFTIAVLLMLIVGLATGTLQKIERKHIPMFVLGGLFDPFIYYVCETYGLRLMNSPTVAEVLLSTCPIFAPILAYILIREQVTWLNIIGIFISTCGVILMIIIGNDNFAIGSPWGVVLCFAAVFATVLYTIILRQFPEKYSNLSIVFYSQLFGWMFFIPAWAIVDLPQMIHTPLVMSEIAIPISAVAYLAAFSSVLAFILFSYTIRKLGVTRANAFNNIRPVFTALLMLLLFGEQLPLSKWLAMLLVIIGLYICQLQKKA